MARYFEDFTVGEEFISRGRTITETDVVLFAGLSGDFNPIHTDAVVAATTEFGQRVAHGPLVFAVGLGLVGRLGHLDGTALAMLGINDWRFGAPVFIGDTIRVRVEVEAVRQSRDPSRGVVTRRLTILNQRDEECQSGTIAVLVKARGTGEEAP